MNNSTVVVANPKRDTQRQISALRGAGLTVNKDSGGMYSCDSHPDSNGDTIRLFTAMPGRNGYLIRRVSNLFA